MVSLETRPPTLEPCTLKQREREEEHKRNLTYTDTHTHTHRRKKKKNDMSRAPGVAAVAGHPVDIEPGAQQYVGALAVELLPQRLRTRRWHGPKSFYGLGGGGWGGGPNSRVFLRKESREVQINCNSRASLSLPEVFLSGGGDWGGDWFDRQGVRN